MKHILTILLLAIGLSANAQSKNAPTPPKAKGLQVQWISELGADFSFANEWSYGEWIFTNDFGQLVCDGFCPDEISGMRDEDGRIYPDSLHAYYQLVDTTHYFYTIQINEWEPQPNWYINVQQTENNGVECYTELGVSTYRLLHLSIANGSCTPTVELHSPAPDSDAVYPCTDGYLKVDKSLWEQGVMKALFRFVFYDETQPKKSFVWSGKIYAPIEPLPRQ